MARGLLALPPGLQDRLAGGGPVVIDGQTLDPQIHLLGSLRERQGGPALSSLSRPGASAAASGDARRGRAPDAGGRGARPPDPGPAGPLAARHYAPAEPGGPHPLLVFFHGGGFVVGDLDTHDAVCRLLCRHGGVARARVDYRLAPEHRFPAAVEDAVAALAWALEHAAELGADPRRVGRRRRLGRRQPRRRRHGGGRRRRRAPGRGPGADLPGHGHGHRAAGAAALRRERFLSRGGPRLVPRAVRARRTGATIPAPPRCWPSRSPACRRPSS